jgi:hypothetical protein
MTEGLASDLPEIMPLLGAEQSHGVEKGNLRQTLHVLSEFLTRREKYQILSISSLGYNNLTKCK